MKLPLSGGSWRLWSNSGLTLYFVSPVRSSLGASQIEESTRTQTLAIRGAGLAAQLQLCTALGKGGRSLYRPFCGPYLQFGTDQTNSKVLLWWSQSSSSRSILCTINTTFNHPSYHSHHLNIVLCVIVFMVIILTDQVLWAGRTSAEKPLCCQVMTQCDAWFEHFVYFLFSA